MSVISNIVKEPDKKVINDKSGRDFNLCIVSDTNISKNCQWLLTKAQLKIYEYSNELFTNRDVNNFIDNNQVSLLWLNVNKKNCREWIQLNHDDLKDNFNIISVYTTFDNWALEVEALTVLSIKQFQRIQYVDAEQMVNNLVKLYKKISPPSKCVNLLSCFKKKGLSKS